MGLQIFQILAKSFLDAPVFTSCSLAAGFCSHLLISDLHLNSSLIMLQHSINFCSHKSGGRQVCLANSFMQKPQTSDLISEFPS